MHGLGGASSIYEGSPLRRRLRDADAITDSIQVAPDTWETVGQRSRPLGFNRSGGSSGAGSGAPS